MVLWGRIRPVLQLAIRLPAFLGYPAVNEVLKVQGVISLQRTVLEK